MSQNIIIAKLPEGEVRLSAGWDRPQHALFCSVMPLYDEDEEDEDSEQEDPLAYLYLASFDSTPALERAIQNSGLTLPRSFYEAVARDEAERAGNVIREFEPDGTYTEIRL